MSNEDCEKTFNTKDNMIQHKLVHLKKKLFQCNYCSHQTNHRQYLNEHIQTKHTRQGLVKCMWP